MIKLRKHGNNDRRVGIQVAAMAEDVSSMQEKIEQYQKLEQNLTDKQNEQAENKRLKFAIPTLLNQVMKVIPKKVQITSITETGETITIDAQSNEYDQLGLFKAKLEQDGILANVVSNESTKESGVVKVTIKGELP